MSAKLPSIVALGCLAGIGSLVLLADRPESEPLAERSSPPLEPAPEDPQPPAPEQPRAFAERPNFDPIPVIASPSEMRKRAKDVAHYRSFLAKRDARDFVRLYNTTLRFAPDELSAITQARPAIERLSAGVDGPGELKFRYRQLSAAEVDAALAYVRHDGERFIATPETEYTADEIRVRKLLDNCKDGNCKDCIDPKFRERAIRMLELGIPSAPGGALAMREDEA